MTNPESLPSKAAEELQIFTLSEVQELASEGYSVIPLVEKMELKESAGALYDRLRGDGPSFLLESADPAEHQGRYSFIGLNPDKVIRLEKEGMLVNGKKHEFGNPFTFVNGLIVKEQSVAPVADLPPFFGGAAGYFGYDLARYREPTIGPAKEDILDLPEMALIVPGTVVALDNYLQEMSLIRNVIINANADEAEVTRVYDQSAQELQDIKDRINSPSLEPRKKSDYAKLHFTPNMTPEEFKAGVEIAREHTFAGDVFQSVPSQRWSSNETVDGDFAHEVFNQLKRFNPSRYGYVVDFGDFAIAGCSPETLVKVSGSKIEHHAIAGTIRRGATPEEDDILAQQLEDDPKERAEHAMLVDLSRNDVARVCEPGSVEVPVLRAIEQYSHVWHGTSKITGERREDASALDVLDSILPAGTLSGAPKIRAMQIIDTLEPDKRGPYGGAVGYITPKDELDTCIFIRSLIVDKSGRVHVQSGAGIVVDSIPDSEYKETVMKAAAVMRAIEEVCEPRTVHQKLVPESHRPVKRPRVLSAAKSIGNLLMIDNYDSFTYLLADRIAQYNIGVEVVRNDAINAKELASKKPDFLVVSPGPGHPSEAGLSADALVYFAERGVPSLGVCLGHQALVLAYGGVVERAKPIHGKTSPVYHDNKGVFKDIENPIEAQRYHSLVAQSPLPQQLIKTAETRDGIIMGVRHIDMAHLEGVQFHPESYFTGSGEQLLRNFLGLVQQQNIA